MKIAEVSPSFLYVRCRTLPSLVGIGDCVCSTCKWHTYVRAVLLGLLDSLCLRVCEREWVQTDVHESVKGTYLVRSHGRSLGPCLHWVTISPFILLLPSLMFWFLLKVLCQCPPSRVPLPCMLIELCIFYYCCQGKIRDTFSKGTLRGQWTQQGVQPPRCYQSSSHMNGAGSRALSFSQLMAKDCLP